MYTAIARFTFNNICTFKYLFIQTFQNTQLCLLLYCPRRNKANRGFSQLLRNSVTPISCCKTASERLNRSCHEHIPNTSCFVDSLFPLPSVLMHSLTENTPYCLDCVCILCIPEHWLISAVETGGNISCSTETFPRMLRAQFLFYFSK